MPAIPARHHRSKSAVTTGREIGASTAPVAAGSSFDESGLRDELSLVERAQHALPDDPRHALALVEEHERRFPDRFLAQEREVTAVAARWKLGRAGEARARADRFIRRFPESAYGPRMRRAIAASATAP